MADVSLLWKRSSAAAAAASSSSVSVARALPRLRLRPTTEVGGSMAFWRERRDFLGAFGAGAEAAVERVRREAWRAAICALVWARAEEDLLGGSGEEEGLQEERVGGGFLGGDEGASGRVSMSMGVVLVVGGFGVGLGRAEVGFVVLATGELVWGTGAATTRRVLNLGFLEVGIAGSSPSSPPKDSSAFPPFFFFAAAFFLAAAAASSNVLVFLTISRGTMSSNGLITTSAPKTLTGYTGRSVPSSHSPCPMRTRLYSVSPTIFPNIVLRPVSSLVSPSVRKNCELLSFLRPELAIPTRPRRLNRSRVWNSSAKSPPS